jgi:prevent-host-death family protein
MMPATDSAYTEIGAFEAKTKLSEILRKVEQGERFTITVRGEAKAQLVPVAPTSQAHTPEEIEAAYQLLRNPRIEGISPETIRAWIEEGRP